MTMKILLGISLALVILIGSVPLGFSESLRVQLEQGIETGQLQCGNPSHVLVLRDNGSAACVTESTSEKTGWTIIETKSIIHISQNEFDETLISDNTQSNSGIDLVKEFVELKVSSDVEFVDDGRVYDTVLQRSPSPNPMYDEIMSSDITPNDIDTDRIISITTVLHEKYSINQDVGLYVEDWMPTYIPDGYKLLYADSNNIDYSEHDYTSSTHSVNWVKYYFVPTDFVLYPNATDHDVLKKSNGFSVGTQISTIPWDEPEDRQENFKERIMQYNFYGEFREMTRDGKFVHAYQGGNNMNPFHATISFQPDEYTIVKVNSNYLTLDELLPIFESIGN